MSLKAIITIVLGFALAFAAGLVSKCERASFWVSVALRGRRIRVWYRAKAQCDHPGFHQHTLRPRKESKRDLA